MIKVRHLKSNTRHSRYGRLYRGLFDYIRPEDFNPVLFERIPESPADMGAPTRCEKTGMRLSEKGREEISGRRFVVWIKKHKKQYELENKLALQRKEGGK